MYLESILLKNHHTCEVGCEQLTEVFKDSTMIIFAEVAIEIWQKNSMQTTYIQISRYTSTIELNKNM